MDANDVLSLYMITFSKMVCGSTFKHMYPGTLPHSWKRCGECETCVLALHGHVFKIRCGSHFWIPNKRNLIYSAWTPDLQTATQTHDFSSSVDSAELDFGASRAQLKRTIYSECIWIPGPLWHVWPTAPETHDFQFSGSRWTRFWRTSSAPQMHDLLRMETFHPE